MTPRDPVGPGDREPLVTARGLALVVVVVALGALLLPSVTRRLPAGVVSAGASGTVPSAPAAGQSSAGQPAAGASSSAGSSSAGSTAPASSAGSSTPPSPQPASSSSSAPQPASSAAPSGPAPSSVQVLVANGTNTAGLAGAVTTTLHDKGFGTLVAVNALTTVPASLVYPVDATGTSAVAEVLAALGLPQSAVRTAVDGPPPVTSTSGVDVVVVAGPDLAGQVSSAGAGTSSSG
ncbi:MAG: LytR C-terminal domain-containing protein [Actinomycetota bacterium]|nr:LytR C-terminal domain-containing protein [Actinomycetota bacterium]